MQRIKYLCIALALCVGSGFVVVKAERAQWYLVGSTPDLTATPELFDTATQLTYLGAFRTPTGSNSDYCVCALAFYDAGDSGNGALFMSSFNNGGNYGGVFLMNTPPPTITGSVASMNRADLLQGDVDALEGHLATDQQPFTSPSIKGMHVEGSTLMINVGTGYDSGGQTDHIYIRPLTLATTGSLAGPYHATLDGNSGLSGNYTRYLSGYMAEVPTALQDILCGTVITGHWSSSILSSISNGTSAFAWTAANASSNPASSTLLFYPDGAHALYNQSLAYNIAWTGSEGAFIPVGYRSVVFLGGKGYGGNARYGFGTSDILKDGIAADECGDPGGIMIYDPDQPSCISKGFHDYPYSGFVNSYDVNDLVSVKNGLASWVPLPYSYFNISDLIPDWASLYAGVSGITGVAHDQVRHRIYISTQKQDGPGPLIHVFSYSTP